MFHGYCRVKKDMGEIKENREGIITAYLPEQKTFAVFFGTGKWFTYQDWTKEQFLEFFELID